MENKQIIISLRVYSIFQEFGIKIKVPINKIRAYNNIFNVYRIFKFQLNLKLTKTFEK